MIEVFPVYSSRVDSYWQLLNYGTLSIIVPGIQSYQTHSPGERAGEADKPRRVHIAI